MYSYLSAEERVPSNHPLRAVRKLTDKILVDLSKLFSQMYSQMGRPSIAPEKLLRALLLQVLYTVRSERMLMEQLDYNMLFRWFVGLNLDEAVWDVTVFTKNRDRLLEADVAKEFFRLVVAEAQALNLMSDEHFTVDGTLLEACASLKSFKKRDGEVTSAPDDPAMSRDQAFRLLPARCRTAHRPSWRDRPSPARSSRRWRRNRSWQEPPGAHRS